MAANAADAADAVGVTGVEGDIVAFAARLFAPGSSERFVLSLALADGEGEGNDDTLTEFCVDLISIGARRLHGLDDPTLMDAAQLAGVTACMRRAGLDVSVAPMVEAASNAAAASRIDALAADVTGAGGRFRVTVRVLPV